MRTYRRDKLLREVAAGKMLARCTMSEDIMYGREKSSDAKWLPARIRESSGDFITGFFSFYPSDFDNHGHARMHENGIIHLYIDSNSSYDFKHKEIHECAKA